VYRKDIVVLLPREVQFRRMCLGFALDALAFTLLRSLNANYWVRDIIQRAGDNGRVPEGQWI